MLKPMATDNLVQKISYFFRLEKTPGSETSCFLRRRDGLIFAVLNKNGNLVSDFRPHAGRTVPARIINKLAAAVINEKCDISADAARRLGITVIKYPDGHKEYLTTSALHRRGLNRYFHEGKNAVIIVNSLSHHNLSVPAKTENCTLNLLHSGVKNISIASGSSLDIDLRECRTIKKLHVADNFTGRIFLSRSSIRRIKLGSDCRADISYHSGENILSLDIGKNFGGSLSIQDIYLKHLNIKEGCNAGISINLCMFYRGIKIGSGCSSPVVCSSVLASFVKIGNSFSGRFSGSSITARQGIRVVSVGRDFSGYIDLSNDRTIQNFELGAEASGEIIFTDCPSVKTVRLGAHFQGRIDFSGSRVVYVQALPPCTGRFIFSGCRNLALLKLPRNNDYKIIDSPRPLLVKVQEPYVFYQFRRIKFAGRGLGSFLRVFRKSLLRTIKRFPH